MEAFDIILRHKVKNILNFQWLQLLGLLHFSHLFHNAQMIKPKTQAPLIKFFQLIVARHPSKRFKQKTSS